MASVATYLTFDGNCRQAMEFYRACFAAELYLLPYSEAPVESFRQVECASERVLHSKLQKGSELLMAWDAIPGTPFVRGNNFSVYVEGESLEETERLFAALSENGTVTMPLQNTFWGARFGTLTDQFGIQWMLNFALSKRA